MSKKETKKETKEVSIDEKIAETLERAVKMLEEINEVLHGGGRWKL